MRDTRFSAKKRDTLFLHWRDDMLLQISIGKNDRSYGSRNLMFRDVVKLTKKSCLGIKRSFFPKSRDVE